LWQYAKGRPSSQLASPTSATRISRHFADPANKEREARFEARLNDEFEDPVHKFLKSLQMWTFVMSRLQVRQMTRYITLLFNRSQNRRGATAEPVSLAIQTTQSFLADEEKVAKVAARWTMEMIRLGYELDRPVGNADVRKSAEDMIATMQTPEHQQTTYVDRMERAMAFLDDALDNGQWNVIQTTFDHPFVIGDAPVVT
jgi:hypothetical protein